MNSGEWLIAHSDWQKAARLLAVLFVGLLLIGATWRLVDRHEPQSVAEPDPVADTIEVAPVMSAETVDTKPDLSTPVLPLASDSKGIGADLGKSVSLVELADRFEEFRRRMPDSFLSLTPLVRFSNEPDDLDVTLIAGPFANDDAVGDFCRIVRLQLSGHCEITLYQGDTLPAPTLR